MIPSENEHRTWDGYVCPLSWCGNMADYQCPHCGEMFCSEHMGEHVAECHLKNVVAAHTGQEEL